MRIDLERDEVELVVDALHVFRQRLLALGTRKSETVARRAIGLANEIEEGKRTVRQ
jgi:hypothetical protein